MENIQKCNSIQELRVMIDALRTSILPHHMAATKERIRTLLNKRRHARSIDNKNDDGCDKVMFSLCSTSLPNLKKWSHETIPAPFRNKAFIAPSRYQGLYIPASKNTHAHWEIIIYFD